MPRPAPLIVIVCSLLLVGAGCFTRTRQIAPAPVPSPSPEGSCKNVCGNGQCDALVCMAIGCPCPENPTSCPQDCQVVR